MAIKSPILHTPVIVLLRDEDNHGIIDATYTQLRLIRIEPPKTDWLIRGAYRRRKLYAVLAAAYKLASYKLEE